MRQLCVRRDTKHLGSSESTQAARFAFGYASSNSYASFVFSKLPAWSLCFSKGFSLHGKKMRFYLEQKMVRFVDKSHHLEPIRLEGS